MFIMVDGIDGSGKRTIVEVMQKFFEDQGRKSFDIGEWSKAHHALPSPDDVGDADLLIGVEPSYAWTGAAIRYEMIKNDRSYHSRDIAAAFSLDRLVIYNRLFLPALKAGKTIIAERGVSSSIAYQPAADTTITLDEVLSLTGNAFALENAPTHLVIADLDPKIAIERLAHRAGKQDDSFFEKESFLKILDSRYKSDWFKQLFKSRGTTVHFVDTSGTKEAVHKNIVSLLTTF